MTDQKPGAVYRIVRSDTRADEPKYYLSGVGRWAFTIDPAKALVFPAAAVQAASIVIDAWTRTHSREAAAAEALAVIGRNAVPYRLPTLALDRDPPVSWPDPRDLPRHHVCGGYP